MCWATDKLNGIPIKHVADEDISVKKVLQYNIKSHSFSSPVVDCRWKIGETKKTKIGGIYSENGNYCIDKGFHSAHEIQVHLSDQGIYSFYQVNKKGNKDYLFRKMYSDVICSFVIPKGSEYYINEYGGYVSNQITFTDVHVDIRYADDYLIDHILKNVLHKK